MGREEEGWYSMFELGRGVGFGGWKGRCGGVVILLDTLGVVILSALSAHSILAHLHTWDLQAGFFIKKPFTACSVVRLGFASRFVARIQLRRWRMNCLSMVLAVFCRRPV